MVQQKTAIEKENKKKARQWLTRKLDVGKMCCFRSRHDVKKVLAFAKSLALEITGNVPFTQRIIINIFH